MRSGTATAQAHPNIALSKYWGKQDAAGNRPAVPSLSITLAGMATTTRVRFDPQLRRDRLELDGSNAGERTTMRVVRLLDAVWGSPSRPRAEVISHNDFPTAAGLASSASAFAALAVAANEAAGAALGTAELSDVARRSSASAARSVLGGFVELPAGPEGAAPGPLFARVVAPPDHWDLRLVVAVTTDRRKAVGSTAGMNHTASTSPLYAAWLSAAAQIHERVWQAVLERDFAALASAAEHSALCMHGTALGAEPGLVYWNGVTVTVLEEVRKMRRDGLEAFFTIDAGPHVKVFTTVEHRADVERRVARVPGVLRTIVARPGPGARVLDPNRPVGGVDR